MENVVHTRSNALAERLVLLLWEVLLFSMLCFPRILSSIKLALLVFILFLSFILRLRISFNRHMVWFLLFQILLAVLKIGTGLIYRNASKALVDTFRMEIVYSTLFVILFTKLAMFSGFREKTVSVIAAANIYIGIYNIIIVLASYAHINVSFLLNLDATAAVGIHTGYSHVVSTNLSMSVITFPLALFFMNSRKLHQKKRLLISVLLCGFAMILSGRRILWLCLGIAATVYFFATSKDPVKLLKRVFLILLVCVLFVVFAQITGMFDFAGVYDRFISAFGKGENAETERTMQIGYLLEGFRNKPLLGNGAGAVIKGFTRSETTPWSFEMTYHALLFQSGLAGALLFILSLSMLIKLIREIRYDDRAVFRGCLVTLFLALIANATNPYFGSSFDFSLFFFLPAACALRCREKNAVLDNLI